MTDIDGACLVANARRDGETTDDATHSSQLYPMPCRYCQSEGRVIAMIVKAWIADSRDVVMSHSHDCALNIVE